VVSSEEEVGAGVVEAAEISEAGAPLTFSLSVEWPGVSSLYLSVMMCRVLHSSRARVCVIISTYVKQQ
jgi:hypothetical protein